MSLIDDERDGGSGHSSSRLGGHNMSISYDVDDKYSVSKPSVRENKNSELLQINANAFKTPSALLGDLISSANVVKYGKGYLVDGFNVKLKDGYAYIKGARSKTALSQKIKGTKYALKNADKYPQVFKFVDPKTAVKDAFDLKSTGGKLGYAGIALDVGIDTYKNARLYNEGKISGEKIATDAVVDIGFGAGGIAASAATGALLGSIVPGAGTVIGVIVGLAVGIGYTALTEGWTPNGRSIKDRTKDGLYNLVK
jgi:hypothetical protein